MPDSQRYLGRETINMKIQFSKQNMDIQFIKIYNGTVVNPTCYSSNGGSLETTFTLPL